MKSAVKWIFAALIVLPAFAQAAPFGMVYTREFGQRLNQNVVASPEAAKPKMKLLYHGGPVLAQVKVYAVMWGSNVDSATQSGIGEMLSATVNSTYFDMLKEYSTTINAVDGRKGTQQRIGRGSFGGTVVIQPANAKLTITDDEIGAELEHQIDIGVLPKPDENTVFMTYYPAGMTIDLQGSLSCEVFCGYHHSFASRAYGTLYYGVHPDLGGNCALGCGVATSRFENLTSVTAHELAEAVTDPAVMATGGPAYPDAWNTTKGEEIGDLCSSENTKLSVGGSSFVLQQAFDNASGGCAAGPFQSP